MMSKKSQIINQILYKQDTDIELLKLLYFCK